MVALFPGGGQQQVFDQLLNRPDKLTTSSGGIEVRGIPIPIAAKGEKLPPLTQWHIEAIKADPGDNVNLENIRSVPETSDSISPNHLQPSFYLIMYDNYTCPVVGLL